MLHSEDRGIRKYFSLWGKGRSKFCCSFHFMVCVCVCVYVRERERETDRQTDRQGESGKENERERQGEREGEIARTKRYANKYMCKFPSLSL